MRGARHAGDHTELATTRRAGRATHGRTGSVTRTGELRGAEEEGQELVVVQGPHAVRARRLCRRQTYGEQKSRGDAVRAKRQTRRTQSWSHASKEGAAPQRSRTKAVFALQLAGDGQVAGEHLGSNRHEIRRRHEPQLRKTVCKQRAQAQRRVERRWRSSSVPILHGHTCAWSGTHTRAS